MKKVLPLAAPRLVALTLFALLGTARCGGDAAPGSATGEGADGQATSTGDDAEARAAEAGPRADDGGSATEDGAVTWILDATTRHRDAGTSADAGARAPDAEAPDGSPNSGSKLVGGYYPNWTPSPVRIRDVDPHYNLIYLFAATPVAGGTGAITWAAPGDGLGAATNLNADIAYARQAQGRKIVMSIGGAGNDLAFPDRTTSQTFVTSVASLYTQLGGFDGIDWDTYEGSDAPDTTEMIWISLQLKSLYPGFLITTPPAPWSTVDQTFCSQMVAAGALDYAAPQYYDGPNLATQSYIVTSVATWASLLGESKLVVGFGVADAANYMTIAQVVSTWTALEASHPGLRGAFDWQIDVDEASGWPFATQLGPLLNP